MNDFASLKVLDRFSFAFEKMGVDYKDMRKILQMKFTLDSRRVTVMERNKGKKGEEEKSFFQKYWGYGFLGSINAMVFFLGDTPFIGATTYFTVLMFLLISTLISDFSSIMLDLKDKAILMTKPIDKKTLSMARFIHVFVYILSMMLFLGGPGVLVAGYRFGLEFSLLMAGMLVIIAFISMFSTSLLYTLLLKRFDGEKLKDVINGFQIAMSITLSVGYQFAVRVFDVVDSKMVFTPKWWAFLIPPVWFGAPFEMLYFGRFEGIYLGLFITGIVVSVVSLFVHFKIIVPNFEGYLSKLETGGEKSVKRPVRDAINRRVARVISFKRVERAFIRFTQVMLTKERSTKLRIYPSLALGIALPIILMVSNSIDRDSVLASMGAIRNYKNVLYFYLTMAMLSPVIPLIKYSDSYKGAWIYRVLPIEDENTAMEGAFKGAILSYSIPVFAVVGLISLSLFGTDVILDLLLMYMAGLTASLALVGQSSAAFPFSEKFVQSENQSDSFGATMIGFTVIGIFAGLHIFLIDNRTAIAIITDVAIVIDYLSWRRIFSSSDGNVKDRRNRELI